MMSYVMPFHSCSDLAYMIDSSKVELERMGLTLNANRTKILTTLDVSDVCHVDVGGYCVEVLHGTTTHKVFGQIIDRQFEDVIGV